MKKMRSILLLVALGTLFLTGCGKKPDDTVEKYCNAMKDFDLETMASCMENSDDIEDMSFDTGDDTSAVLLDYLKGEAKDIKHKILKSDVNGDKATVSVAFKYNDQSTILKTTMGNYIQQGIAQAFSGQEIDTDELFKKCLDDAINAESKKKTAEMTVDFSCVMIDKDWKIAEVEEKAGDAMFGNAITVFKEMADSFNSADTSTNTTDNDIDSFSLEKSQDEDIDEENYIEVAAGDVIELASAKIKINSCKESKEISNSYSTTEAKEGTKFVQLEVTVENTTKKPFDFDIDSQIIDDQGRTYSEFSDSFISADNYIKYRELSPNIPEVGTITFNVPEDSQNFYMPLVHAETNQVYHMICQ